MRNFFLWTPQIEAEVARVRAYAEQPANWYHPGPDATSPGDNPSFRIHAGTNIAVFTWTDAPKPHGLFRHLSVSVRGRGHGVYPRIEAVCTFAHYFGFTGAHPMAGATGCYDLPGPWAVMEYEGCIVVQEPVPDPRS